MHPSAQAIAPNNALLAQNRAAVSNLHFSVNQNPLRLHKSVSIRNEASQDAGNVSNPRSRINIRTPRTRKPQDIWSVVEPAFIFQIHFFISALSNMQVKSAWSTEIWEQYARNSASRRRWFRRSLLKRTATKCAWKMTWWHVLQCTLPYGSEGSSIHLHTSLKILEASRGGSRSSKAKGSPPQLLAFRHRHGWQLLTILAQKNGYDATALLTRPLSSSSTSASVTLQVICWPSKSVSQWMLE